MKTWQLIGLLSVAPLLYGIAVVVAFAAAGLHYEGRSGWSFDAGPVATVAIGGVLLVIATTLVVLADHRPKALSRWRVWGGAIVLALLTFTAMLLLTRGLFDTYAWPPDAQQVDRFLIAGRIALAIIGISSAIALVARRSRNAVAATWLTCGMLLPLVGLTTWMSWSWSIP